MTGARNGRDKDIMFRNFRGVDQTQVRLVECGLRMGSLPNIRKLRFHFQAGDQEEIRRLGDGCGERASSTKYLKSFEWGINVKPASNVKRAGRRQSDDLFVAGNYFDFGVRCQW